MRSSSEGGNEMESHKTSMNLLEKQQIQFSIDAANSLPASGKFDAGTLALGKPQPLNRNSIDPDTMRLALCALSSGEFLEWLGIIVTGNHDHS